MDALKHNYCIMCVYLTSYASSIHQV